MSREISIKNIGPITEFEYELGDFGVHVLRGKQGAGKTTCLRAVELAVNGRSDVGLTKRDGAQRGEVSIAGHVIRIQKVIREEGDLSVDGLGDISIAELHSPKFKNAATRDQHRIRTLVRLAGVEADVQLFREQLGERFDAIVPVDSLKTDDLVEMAARVKRAYESEAQRVEKRVETEQANARAQAAIAEVIDIERPHDESELQDDLARAMQTESARKAELDALVKAKYEARTAGKRAAEARDKLDELGGGATVAEATAKLEVENGNLAAVDSQIERFEAKLREAKQARREVLTKRDAAEAALEAAKREEALYAELHAIIDAASSLVPPDEDEIETAETQLNDAKVEVAAAKSAITEGAKIRAAIAAKSKSDEHMAAANKLSTEARRLRGAAADTFSVLTNAIARINDCPLRVALSDEGDPRLVLETDRSEAEPFDELSDGLKWLHVVRIAASANRLIVLSQSAFGELSPSSKAYLDKLAKEHKCWVLSAEADDCELHGTPYTATRSAAE